MKLRGKIIFRGKISTQTGLHIGGSKASLKIGGMDNEVLKTIDNKPYIPGSSLKGKLRSLLAKAEGSLFFSEKEKVKEELCADSADKPEVLGEAVGVFG